MTDIEEEEGNKGKNLVKVNLLLIGDPEACIVEIVDAVTISSYTDNTHVANLPILFHGIAL